MSPISVTTTEPLLCDHHLGDKSCSTCLQQPVLNDDNVRPGLFLRPDCADDWSQAIVQP